MIKKQYKSMLGGNGTVRRLVPVSRCVESYQTIKTALASRIKAAPLCLCMCVFVLGPGNPGSAVGCGKQKSNHKFRFPAQSSADPINTTRPRRAHNTLSTLTIITEQTAHTQAPFFDRLARCDLRVCFFFLCPSRA